MASSQESGQGRIVWRTDRTPVVKEDVKKALSYPWAAELQINPSNETTVVAALRELKRPDFHVIYTSSVAPNEIQIFNKEDSGCMPSDRQLFQRLERNRQERKESQQHKEFQLGFTKERASVAIIQDMLTKGMSISDIIKDFKKNGKILKYYQISAIKKGKVKKSTITVRREGGISDVQA